MQYITPQKSVTILIRAIRFIVKIIITCFWILLKYQNFIVLRNYLMIIVGLPIAPFCSWKCSDK